MPHFMFSVPTGSEVQGCIERLCLYTPWPKPMPALNSAGQQIFDQAGRPMVIQPKQAAYNWLASQTNYVWPQNVNLNCLQLSDSVSGREPVIYCIQKTEASIERAQVNAPFSTPFGSSKVLTMPPQAAPEGSQRHQHGMYEEIDGSGLVNNADPLMGEVDGHGGTFTDFSPTTRKEEIRQMAIPQSELRPR